MKTFDIHYTLTAPVSHIGETASTGSYFQTINTLGGRLPVITGNSVRGILRDKLAANLLTVLGTPVDKETFNVLFSGGNISGSTKNDVERAKLVRQHFPMISLLGGGLGTMIMSGNLVSGFVYPVCRESEFLTGIASDVSWHDLIDDIEFTRMDDTKEDKNVNHITDIEEEKKGKASTQMRFSVQYLSAGTEMFQRLVLLDSASEIEEGALLTALLKWFNLPVLGGMKAKGFGTFFASVNDGIITVDSNGTHVSDYAMQKIIEYNQFLNDDDPASWIYLIKEGGKRGKA
jgi:hypothetical protein